MSHEEIREAMEHVIGLEPSLHQDGEALPTEFVEDHQDLDWTGIARAVCYEVRGPDMVTMGGLSMRQTPSLSHRRPRLGCFWGTFSPSLFQKEKILCL